MPGFVWHCVGSTEDGDRVTVWMPLFEDNYADIPIHLASEPHSYLMKVTINTATKKVEELKKFTEIGPLPRDVLLITTSSERRSLDMATS